MELKEAMDILYTIARGIDPRYGKPLDIEDVCNDVEVVRALYLALSYLNYNEQDTHIPDSFCLGESHDGKLREYYIPFDYVNTRTKIIIVGLTPGRTQWENAVLTAQKSMLEGDDEETVLRKAKQTGAFSGGMRGTLIEMLDYISLNKELGIDSVARCFEENSQDIHFTSVFTLLVTTIN